MTGMRLGSVGLFEGSVNVAVYWESRILRKMHSLLLYQPSLYSLAHAVATCRQSLLLIDHHPCHEKWGATNTVRQSVAVFLGSVREHLDISVAFPGGGACC